MTERLLTGLLVSFLLTAPVTGQLDFPARFNSSCQTVELESLSIESARMFSGYSTPLSLLARDEIDQAPTLCCCGTVSGQRCCGYVIRCGIGPIPGCWCK